MISTELKKLVDPKNECCCEYHLAHECKEWAYKNNFDIWSSNLNICECSNNKTFNGIERFIADTELEAIFKACEWIMEQTKCGS